MRPADLSRVALIGISGYAKTYLEWVEAAADQGRIALAAVVVINLLVDLTYTFLDPRIRYA